MEYRRKKILFINGHLNVGGTEKSLVDLLCKMDYSRNDVDLLLLEGKGDYYSQLPNAVNVICRDITHAYGPLGKMIISNFKRGNYADILVRIVLLLSRVSSKKVLRLLLFWLRISNYYDAAIAYRPGICTDILVYAVRSGRKISWWHHGDCTYDQQTIEYSNVVWKHLDYMVTVSEGCKRMLAEEFDLSENKYVVIPNMIDVEHITYLAGNASPYEMGRLQIVTVGRLSEEKHVINAIYAAQKLREAGVVDFCWNIIGDGDDLEMLKTETNKLHLQDQICFWGMKSNPYPYIKYADMLVHTSYVESQCITVLEAMALRTPCVVCRSLGPQEFMRDGVNGIMVEHGTDNLVRGVMRMISLSDKDILTENAFHTVNEGYSPKKTINRLNGLI